MYNILKNLLLLCGEMEFAKAGKIHFTTRLLQHFVKLSTD